IVRPKDWTEAETERLEQFIHNIAGDESDRDAYSWNLTMQFRCLSDLRQSGDDVQRPESFSKRSSSNRPCGRRLVLSAIRQDTRIRLRKMSTKPDQAHLVIDFDACRWHHRRVFFKGWPHAESVRERSTQSATL